MAASGRSSVTLLCVCSVVVVVLLLVDCTAALEHQGKRETGIVGSTQEFYLRGNPIIPTENPTEEPEETFESFERRELVDGDYNENPGSANCDTNNTNCP